MKSLTLHAMDDQLAECIRRRADELSISMNELAKRMLAEGFGIKTPEQHPHLDDFSCFCGTWSKLDAEEFNQRTQDMDRVNAEDWQ